MFGELLSKLRSGDRKSNRRAKSDAARMAGLPEEYLALYNSIHETCAPGVPASPLKIRRKYFVFQYLKLLRANSTKATTAEFGVFRGQTSMMMTKVLDRPDDQHHIFDSFEGLSESTKFDKETSSSFGDMSPDMAHIRSLLPNAHLHRGWIPRELPDLDEKIDFAHVDLDLHEPVSGALKWIYERRVPGSAIIVDDYSGKWPGCVKAVDDFVKENAKNIAFAADTTFANFVIVLR